MEIKFSKILSERLEGENLSRLARDLDIPKSLLHDWCISSSFPSMKSMKHVKILASYLGLTVDELFFGEQKKKTISSISFTDSGREYRVNIERLK